MRNVRSAAMQRLYGVNRCICICKYSAFQGSLVPSYPERVLHACQMQNGTQQHRQCVLDISGVLRRGSLLTLGHLGRVTIGHHRFGSQCEKRFARQVPQSAVQGWAPVPPPCVLLCAHCRGAAYAAAQVPAQLRPR